MCIRNRINTIFEYSKKNDYNTDNSIFKTASHQAIHIKTMGDFINKEYKKKNYDFIIFQYFNANTLGGIYDTRAIYIRTKDDIEEVFSTLKKQIPANWYYDINISHYIESVSSKESIIKKKGFDQLRQYFKSRHMIIFFLIQLLVFLKKLCIYFQTHIKIILNTVLGAGIFQYNIFI
eukprot:TRINITY_DN37877_c0_g1_i1.p1 TRINITY_DN37877_c0_g1~~TRINITY_DN37877_c0_g1_i1.p1  ORF type:complete len:177 (+),score=6.89 TRINITY_DN37877_c0_g1_i1:53-583(+)